MRRLLYIFIFVFTASNAAPLDIGSSIDTLNDFGYTDQRGQKLRIPKDTRVIAAAFDKDTAYTVNELLHVKHGDYLHEHKALFITDMSEAPSLFARMFAIPKLRKYKHPVYIVRDEGFKDILPNKEDKVTILYIDEQTIKEAVFVSTPKELEEAIER